MRLSKLARLIEFILPKSFGGDVFSDSHEDLTDKIFEAGGKIRRKVDGEYEYPVYSLSAKKEKDHWICQVAVDDNCTDLIQIKNMLTDINKSDTKCIERKVDCHSIPQLTYLDELEGR